jgi:hypothetical protein
VLWWRLTGCALHACSDLTGLGLKLLRTAGLLAAPGALLYDTIKARRQKIVLSGS